MPGTISQGVIPQEQIALEALALKVVELRRRIREASKRALAAESEASTLRRRLAYQKRRTKQAKDEANFLHGILILHGIEIPERLNEGLT